MIARLASSIEREEGMERTSGRCTWILERKGIDATASSRVYLRLKDSTEHSFSHSFLSKTLEPNGHKADEDAWYICV